MWIPDLVLVEAPDLRPAPRIFEELAGDAPKRIAFFNNVPVGCTVLQFQRALSKHPGRVRQKNELKEYDRLSHGILTWKLAQRTIRLQHSTHSILFYSLR